MVKVVVADDHPVVREGLVRLLLRSGTIDVMAEASDGHDAVRCIRTLRPDVALVDHEMPGLDGAEVAQTVRDLRTRVLVLSAHVGAGIVERAVRCGAVGYLSKDAGRDEIVRAVHDAAAGRTVRPGGPRPVLGVSTGPAEAPAVRLSAREREVLGHLARGTSVPAMAQQLYLAPSTVKTHVQRLYAKLGVSDRAAAVAVAMRTGLIQ